MSEAAISAAELRELLDQGRPVRIIDIRRPGEREWTIPGSVAVDAYDADEQGDWPADAEDLEAGGNRCAVS